MQRKVSAVSPVTSQTSWKSVGTDGPYLVSIRKLADVIPSLGSRTGLSEAKNLLRAMKQ